jgi:hypothetical protein
MGHPLEFDDKRKADSRRRIQRELDVAYGLYIQQEPVKGDSWRDMSIWDLFKHLEHELKEIDRSHTTERKYHNSLDAAVLSIVFAARLRTLEEQGNLLEGKRHGD